MSLLSLRDRTLSETLADLQQQVRSQPGEARHRVFLFQLLAVLGQWDRALQQLTVAGELDPATLAMVQTYREALRCEVFRAGVFAGERTPLVLGDPPAWIAPVLQALELEARGRHADAAALRAGALEQAEAVAGRIDVAAADAGGGERVSREPFAWLADADTRLGPVLEAVVNGRYYWIPFERIRQVTMERPADLRDLVWTPVQLQWTNGGDAVGLVPTRYPGSEQAADDGVRLARRTEWTAAGDDAHRGLGQRLLASDTGEYALLDVRRVAFGPAANDGDA
jgi:type VI secretion system protein ImpE